MLPKKKLSILINSMNGGGAERIVSILLKKFISDYDVFLVLLNKGIAYDIPKEVKIIYLANLPLKIPNILKFLNIPFLAYKYYRFCKKNNIQISFSLLNRSNYINIFSKILGGKYKAVISERASTLEVYATKKFKDRLSRFLVKFFYPKANFVIAISKGIEKDLVNLFNVLPNKIKTIYNPINLNNLNIQSLQINKKNKQEFEFIAIGRFYEQKNYPLLLEAFSLLIKKNLPVKLNILGDGPLKQCIQKIITELNLDKKVSLLGFQTNIYQHLKNADCFVLTSNYEGFGNVIIEALSCNKVVIATDCNHGPSEILNDQISPVVKDQFVLAKYGILVPLNNAEILANAMEKIIKNSSIRESYELKAFERASHFDQELICKQYIEILEN